jgi:hypothetical protein
MEKNRKTSRISERDPMVQTDPMVLRVRPRTIAVRKGARKIFLLFLLPVKVTRRGDNQG